MPFFMWFILVVFAPVQKFICSGAFLCPNRTLYLYRVGTKILNYGRSKVVQEKNQVWQDCYC